jgi:hypothetical protein
VSAELIRHARVCADCAELLPLMIDAGPRAIDPPRSLAGSVLGLTVGESLCRQAEETMVDESSDPARESLVRLHLDDCKSCAAFERALGALAVDLPAMVELDPGPEFAPGILARTVAGVTAVSPGIVERMRELARSFVRRPRFAMELSYVGGVVVWFTFGIAGLAPLNALASWMHDAPVAVVEEAGRLTLDTTARFGNSADRFVRESSRRVRRELDARYVRTSETRESISRAGSDLRRSAAEFDLGRGSKLAGELGLQLMRLPQQFLMERTAPDGAPPTLPTHDDQDQTKESTDERAC